MPKTPKPRRSDAAIAEEGAVDQDGSPLLTPPGQPPRGKKLRSGRKEPATSTKKRGKRTREQEPIEEEGGKKQKKVETDDVDMEDGDGDEKMPDRQENGSIKEDAEMQDADEKKTNGHAPSTLQQQQQQQGQNFTATKRTNGAAAKPKVTAAAAASNSTSNGVAPIKNLGLPCDQTPGKPLAETARIEKTPYHAPPKKILQSAKPPPTLGRVLAEPYSALQPQRTVNASASPDIAPNRVLFQDRPVIEVVEDPEDHDTRSDSPLMLESPVLWSLVFAVLYFLNAHRVNDLSTSSVYYYKNITGVPPLVDTKITEIPRYIKPDPIVEERIVERRVPSTKPDESAVVEDRLSNNLDAAINDFSGNSFQTIGDAHSLFDAKLRQLSNELQERREKLQQWAAAVDKAERALDDVLNGQIGSPADVLPVVQHIGEVGRTPITTDLVEASVIPLWTIISPLGCPEPEPIRITNVAVKEDLVLGRDDELRSFALSLLSQAKNDESVSAAVAAHVRDRMVDVNGDNAIIQPEVPKLEVGLTKMMAHAAIQERFEKDYADETGAVDMASVTNGAQVITTGKRATSPSLKDTLPLMNRLMHNTKLRFYGHGPEVALTPSVPWDAIGQCWSFENASKSKDPAAREKHRMDRVNGKFATLSIRLPSAVKIGRISIDHGGQKASAIRNFRVSGFTNRNAAGRPIDLGSYQLDAYAGSRSQTFRIEDQDIPQIESITIAIDSTYGEIYGCLYRIRVLPAGELGPDQNGT